MHCFNFFIITYSVVDKEYEVYYYIVYTLFCDTLHGHKQLYNDILAFLNYVKH